MKLTILPLTRDLWPALENLFGEKGACGGCWCMYWRIGQAYRRNSPKANKAAFKRIVEEGPPPGLIAFEDDLAIGWCQLTSRQALPWLDRTWESKPAVGSVWSISCFYIRKGYRRRGVTSALISAALKAAKASGAATLEAYPLDATLSPSSTGTGYVSTFERAGFKIIGHRTPPRPIMRYDLSRNRPLAKPRASRTGSRIV
jgi:GNAT superfamily N-acetyltransferase